jgi:hypothetical protein
MNMIIAAIRNKYPAFSAASLLPANAMATMETGTRTKKNRKRGIKILPPLSNKTNKLLNGKTLNYGLGNTRDRANSLIVLRKAAIQFDIRTMISNIRVPLLYVLSRTDKVFPTSIALKTMEMFKKFAIDACLFEIDSDNVHRAPSVDWFKWENELKISWTNKVYLLYRLKLTSHFTVF